MKCLRCQNEVSENAKFCTKCGLNLSSVQPVKMQAPNMQLCTKCGAKLLPGVRFCTNCGSHVNGGMQSSDETMLLEEEEPVVQNQSAATDETMLLEEEEPVVQNQSAASDETMLLEEEEPVIQNQSTASDETMLLEEEPVIQNQSAASDKTTLLEKEVPPMTNAWHGNDNNNINGYQYVPGNSQSNMQTGQPKAPDKKSGINSSVVIISILGVLIVAAAVVCALIWFGTITIPFGLDNKVQEQKAEESTTEESSTEAVQSVAGDVETLFAPVDDEINSAEEMLKDDNELLNCVDMVRAGIDQYKAIADENNAAEAVNERIAKAYSLYVQAVSRRKEILSTQGLSGGIYAQIMNEMNDAVSYGDDLNNTGYQVDSSSLAAERDEFDKNYRGQLISAFNEFTKRDNWSRTEAWNLMQDTPDNMYDQSNLDDPVRLRFAYALAWWTQKQLESDLNSGVITEKGAAQKIADVIELTDYNPMLLNYYIQYMKDSEEDCSSVENAYNEIVSHISDTQGLKIGEDVDLAHFWYFNDFGEYSVDAVNGVTQENREWIRNRMSAVQF